jgi:hypothetical protein
MTRKNATCPVFIRVHPCSSVVKKFVEVILSGSTAALGCCSERPRSEPLRVAKKSSLKPEEWIARAQSTTPEGGRGPHLQTRILLSQSVSIRVHPWLKSFEWITPFPPTFHQS